MGTPGTSQNAPEVVRRLLSWYRRNARPLPWRQTRQPYRILISEVMLQQTQVARVLQKYPGFIRQFPTFSALARATKRDVVMAWQGLGYNNRAVRLHALARRVHADHRGRFPRNVDDAMQLPGVGRYTAHAVAAFAFAQRVPVVDVNIRRVLSRVFFRMSDPSQTLDDFTAWSVAAKVLPPRRAYDWNQALMDFGATICTAARPGCHDCPLARRCGSRAMMAPLAHRASSERPAISRREPTHRGAPLRLYRGRIVEALRAAHPRRSVEASQLGKSLLPRFTGRDREVFHRLLRALERDGLIRVRRSRTSGPQRVGLA